MKEKSSEYASAGVDIDAGRRAVELMRDAVRSTWSGHVIDEYGGFAGLFDAKGLAGDILAVTIDGVGTKLKVASMVGSYESVGMDIVNHCTDDLLVQRARPMLFADYFASSNLDPVTVSSVVSGMADACRTIGCNLIAGETAEMPGVYSAGEFDVVGCMIGSARRRELEAVQPVVPGDILIGLPSSGLHTNGFSLARKLVFETAKMDVDTEVPELGCSVGEALLAVHRQYLTDLEPHLGDGRIHALAHITGGGFFDNVERVLPEGCAARIDKSAWTPPPIFRMLCEIGGLGDGEAYRVFNMGVGLVVIVARESVDYLVPALSNGGFAATVIGEVASGERSVAIV